MAGQELSDNGESQLWQKTFPEKKIWLPLMAKKPHCEGEVLVVPWAQLGSDVPILIAQSGASRQLGGWWRWSVCAGVCVLAGVMSLTPFLPPVFSSIYKDSNTLHLPTERFSPVRRFSDGAASIQAFKAHLEKMGNNSSIKQLQQVREGWGSSKQPPQGILTASVLLLQEVKE